MVRYALAHLLPIPLLMHVVALLQIPIHALICSTGMDTLGSACAALELPLRKAQARSEVLQALAPAMPVASVMFFLHWLIVEGDMPTAVWPYSCAGLTAVMANVLFCSFVQGSKLGSPYSSKN